MITVSIAALALSIGVQQGDDGQRGTRGVRHPAPGITEIDGAKVRSHKVDLPGVVELIAKQGDFKPVNKMLGKGGIPSRGPSGATTYLYKIHDTKSDAETILLLFVMSGTILGHSVMDMNSDE